jgi:hypothetical protein
MRSFLELKFLKLANYPRVITADSAPLGTIARRGGIEPGTVGLFLTWRVARRRLPFSKFHSGEWRKCPN